MKNNQTYINDEALDFRVLPSDPNRLTCPWCEEFKLTAWWNGNKVFLACSSPALNNCPDTTGLCDSVDEAIRFAMDLCEPKGLVEFDNAV